MGEQSDSERNIEGDEAGQETGATGTVPNRKRNTLKKSIGHLWNNALKRNTKDIFIFKAKLIIYAIVAVLVFFALIIEGDAEETSTQASRSISQIYAGSDSQSAQMYNETGSLILATDTELEKIKNNYFEEIKDSREGYYEALNIFYSGKNSSTVANKVSHITSNFEANEVQEIDVIAEKAIALSGEATPKDNRTIYEHILRTEKYNFNNIIWRSFVKSGSGVTASDISFTVDTDSKLKYPTKDTNAINNADQDLEFFITKVRPYLQSWHIPFDLIIGTQDAQAGTNLNTNFAYEIITNAYHEIVLDRYKLEKLARKTNYLIYDKTTLTTTTTRTCGTYEVITTESGETRKAGEKCTKEEYDAGRCKDSNMQFEMRCERYEIENKKYGCEDIYDTYMANCIDSFVSNGFHGCTYGVLASDYTPTQAIKVQKTYCTDETTEASNVKEDVRETKVEGTSDTLTYSWNYVISMAKMWDKVISNEYTFESYYKYSLDNYKKFINKTDIYANMTVEQFRDSEKTLSQADDFTVEDKDYNVVEDPIVDNTNSSWNSGFVVDIIPSGATLVGDTTSKTVKKIEEVTKVGKEYIDQYSWADNLNFKESKSGIYNLESVKDVTGDDLTFSDITYYNNLYMEKDINLVDLMNSNDEIYNEYVDIVDRSTSTSNIGIRKSALDISYNVLKKNLTELADSYPLSGLMYGNSLGILEGLNLSSIVASGSTNEAILLVASSHLGNDLDHMMSLNNYGTFFRNHWCAMFVSYCMREVEHQTGTTIPIPSFTGCTTFWRNNNTKPGFYDVQEWVQNNPTGACVQSDPNHIAPLSSIQPGDILLYSWLGTEGIRNHTAIVKSVEKDESGKVIAITSIDGNWGTNNGNYNVSKVREVRHSIGGGEYNDLGEIASFVSVSTVIAEAERGNIW